MSVRDAGDGSVNSYGIFTNRSARESAAAYASQDRRRCSHPPDTGVPAASRGNPRWTMLSARVRNPRPAPTSSRVELNSRLPLPRREGETERGDTSRKVLPRDREQRGRSRSTGVAQSYPISVRRRRQVDGRTGRDFPLFAGRTVASARALVCVAQSRAYCAHTRVRIGDVSLAVGTGVGGWRPFDGHVANRGWSTYPERTDDRKEKKK